MKKPKKIISHRFLNRYTVVGAILLAAYGILASEAVFGSIFGGIIGTLASDMALFPLGVVPGALVVHTIHDIVAFLDISTISDGIMARAFRWEDLPDLLLAVSLGFVAFWLICPAKRGEILALWREKWQPLPEPTAEENADKTQAV